MIAHLRGTVLSLSERTCIIDVCGVGYLAHISSSTQEFLSVGEEASLHIITVVREDDISLYGFLNIESKQTFETLCKVNKVGPKLANMILGHLSLPELFHAIEKDQVAFLSKVPGIGKRTAERLCLELKGKLVAPLGGAPTAPLLQRSRVEQDPLQLALAQLDYRKSEIDNVLGSGEIPSKEDASLQERLRAALRFLATQQ